MIFAETKHFDAKVKVLDIKKGRAEVEYLSHGHDSQLIGDKEQVDLVRLKPVIEPLYRMKRQPQNLVSYARDLLKKNVANKLCEAFLLAQYFSFL